ncbi:MAG: hypothetical protein R3B82_04720 [Sandaracinaceae bacterium]
MDGGRDGHGRALDAALGNEQQAADLADGGVPADAGRRVSQPSCDCRAAPGRTTGSLVWLVAAGPLLLAPP